MGVICQCEVPSGSVSKLTFITHFQLHLVVVVLSHHRHAPVEIYP
jgi:hypothetical protein